MGKDKSYDPSRLLRYLQVFGAVHFDDYRVENGEVWWACITLETRKFIVKDLEKFISDKMSDEGGYSASLEFIEESDLGNGRFKYMAEIVPDKKIRQDEARRESIYHFLHSLPRFIRDFRQKNPARERKK